MKILFNILFLISMVSSDWMAFDSIDVFVFASEADTSIQKVLLSPPAPYDTPEKVLGFEIASIISKDTTNLEQIYNDSNDPHLLETLRQIDQLGLFYSQQCDSIIRTYTVEFGPTKKIRYEIHLKDGQVLPWAKWFLKSNDTWKILGEVESIMLANTLSELSIFGNKSDDNDLELDTIDIKFSNNDSGGFLKLGIDINVVDLVVQLIDTPTVFSDTLLNVLHRLLNESKQESETHYLKILENLENQFYGGEDSPIRLALFLQSASSLLLKYYIRSKGNIFLFCEIIHAGGVGRVCIPITKLNGLFGLGYDALNSFDRILFFDPFFMESLWQFKEI